MIENLEKKIASIDKKVDKLSRQRLELVEKKKESIGIIFETYMDGALTSGPVTLTPYVDLYQWDGRLGFQLQYQAPDESYAKELMSLRFISIDEDGEVHRNYSRDEKEVVGMRLEKLSFYSTSGWGETELHRCILIGKVADKVNYWGDKLGVELLSGFRMYNDEIDSLQKQEYDLEKEKREIQAQISKIKLEGRSVVGMKYKIEQVGEEELRWHDKIEFRYGYGRYDYIRLGPGMSYQILRRTPKKCELALYNSEGEKSFDRLIKKETVDGIIKGIISSKKLTASPYI